MSRKEEIGRKAAEAFNTRAVQPTRDALGRISIPTKEDIGRSAANAFWEASRLGFRYEIVPNNNLAEAKRMLEGGDWDSGIVFYDSLGIPGAAMIADLLGRELAPLNMIAGIAEFDHHIAQPRGNFPRRVVDRVEHAIQGPIIQGVRQTKGFEFISGTAPQSDEHLEEAERESSGGFKADVAQRAVDFLRIPGHVLVIPQPTKDGALVKANPRLYAILRLARRRTFAMAIGIDSDTRRLIPPYSKARMIPGVPFSLEDIAQEFELLQELSGRDFDNNMTDIMMRRLAILLKRKRQGPYKKLVGQA